MQYLRTHLLGNAQDTHLANWKVGIARARIKVGQPAEAHWSTLHLVFGPVVQVRQKLPTLLHDP